MSAMHWEARRRQQVVDRRLSATSKQSCHVKKEEESNAHVTLEEPVERDKQCNCNCHSKTAKRYTSLQYSQQW